MLRLDRLREKPVYIYMDDNHGVPAPTRSGSQIRRFTNIRAYLDLGFSVEVVYFKDLTKKRHKTNLKKEGLDFSFTEIDYLPPRPTVFQRIAYHAGFPFETVLDLSFRMRKAIQREVQVRERSNPGAIHQFEYFSIASAIVGMKNVKAIWSCHDLPLDRRAKISTMRGEVEKDKKNKIRYLLETRRKNLRRKYMWWIEKAIIEESNLVLMISEEERQDLSKRYDCDSIVLLPMSWPQEILPAKNRSWMEDGKLRLFHLGKIDAFIGYYSLKFLLGNVFPLLSDVILDRLELNVVGEIGNSDYSQHILELAKQYPNVRFVGYVDDVLSYYRASDLQVVGSPVSTGLRTRIIESFVYGLPVLSTHAGAAGVLGLQDRKNILLAKDSSSFAALLSDVVRRPEILALLAEGARKTYEQQYSRRVVKRKLAGFLERYL